MKKNSLKKILSLCIALALLAALNISAFAMGSTMSVAQDIPTSQSITAGQDLTLHFGVLLTDGSGLSFQWHTESGAISGATNPTLTAKYYQNVAVYCVAVSGSGQAVTSNTCYISVAPTSGGAILPDPLPTVPPTPVPTAPPANNPSTGMPTPVITRQPVGATLADGQSATLSVEAALQDWSGGAQLRYQWYKSSTNSASTAAPIANAYSPTYTTSPYDRNAYYLVAVWSTDGTSSSNVVYSNMVAVTYGSTQLKITKHPTGETVNAGASALFIARADNAVKREWRIVSKDTTKTVPASQAPMYFRGLNISGDQTDSLALSNIPAEMDGWSVECKFTGADGKTLYTNGAIIRVNGATPTPTPSSYIPGATTSPSPSPSSYIPGSNLVSAPTISSHPVGAVLSEGETVTLSVSATGADAAKGVQLSYQWYRSEQNSNANGTPISGATAQTYVPDTISGSRYYYVGVTASNGTDSKTIYSSPATVTYTAPIATPSPSPSPTPSAAPVKNPNNPGLMSMIAGPIIVIAVAAVVIGVGVFFLLKNLGNKKDEDYFEEDHYDEYYESRSSRDERTDRRERSERPERRSSRRIDKEYYSDDEFDR